MSQDPRLLDHVYDGIQEYDNPTPGWWHAIFLGSVVFSAAYLFFWHASPLAKTHLETAQATEARFMEALFGDIGELEPDARTLMTMMDVEGGKWELVARGLYRTNCVSCHGQDGQGLVGTNLTDDYYKNLTDVEGIVTVLEDGAANGSMPAWKQRLNDNQIIVLASYVASLRGKNLPGPRGAEGEIIAPWPEFEIPTATDEAATEDDQGTTAGG